MTNRLAENIRVLRKERSLTQEQLAEVLGVTTGAVYKWEAKLSQPELNMVMEFADFFDTSVDVLLGYEMKDNHLEKSVERLKQYRHEKNMDGLAEAEKSLKKYPNNFDIVYNSAALYRAFGIEKKDERLLKRALELYENSRLLVSQNTDFNINESILCGHIAEVLLSLGAVDKAVDMLKKHNAGGIYNDLIGMTMASEDRYIEKAMPYLSDALLEHVVALIRTVIGYFNLFCHQKAYGAAKEIILWGIQMISGLKNEGEVSYFDKMECVFLACLSGAQLLSGESNKAHESLLRAKKQAVKFDDNSKDDLDTIRFIGARGKEKVKAKVYDDMGTTAMLGIANVIASFENEELTDLWRGLE